VHIGWLNMLVKFHIEIPTTLWETCKNFLVVYFFATPCINQVILSCILSYTGCMHKYVLINSVCSRSLYWLFVDVHQIHQILSCFFIAWNINCASTLNSVSRSLHWLFVLVLSVTLLASNCLTRTVFWLCF